METRTVYRYENRYGHGPYRGGADWSHPDEHMDLCDAHANVDHPTWGYDHEMYGYYTPELPRLPYSYVAGFDSRESLDAWFDGWHETLERNGFSVVVREVPVGKVVDSYSGLQLAFDRS